MKKFLLLLLLTLLSFVLIAQERELSDYEKYRIEKDNERLEQQDEEVFYIVEDMPKFQGKDGKEFRKYIAENVRYPQEAVKNGITGKVIVSFIVDKNGKVVDAKVEKSVDPYLDAEAIRVVESSPKWIAGKQRGKAVKVQFTFPINFVLDTPDESETVVINNYYDYTQPNLRFNLTFGYGYSYHYQPYYGYPTYGAWYSGYYDYYAYYGMYYPYWGYNRHYNYSHYWYHNHWNHNYYSYNYYNKPNYNRRNYTRPSTIRDPKNYASRNNVGVTRTVPSRDVRTTRTTGERRSYTPTYKNPKMNTRPSYNSTTTRTRTTSVQPQSRSTQQRSTRVSTQSSTRPSTYARPSSSSKPTYQRSTTQSRSYSAPARSSSSRSYSTPSRSSSSYSRSSSGSSSRSSGSATRSSSSGASRSSSGRR